MKITKQQSPSEVEQSNLKQERMQGVLPQKRVKVWKVGQEYPEYIPIEIKEEIAEEEYHNFRMSCCPHKLVGEI